MTKSAPPAVLVVDDEPQSVEAIARIIEDDFTVFRATNADQALRILGDEWIQAILCDQRMEPVTGLELLTEVRERWPEVVRLIITGYTNPDDMIRMINEAGIYQFITKPWHPDGLTLALRNAVNLYGLQREHNRMAVELRLLEPSLQSRLSLQREKLQRSHHFDAIVRAPGSPVDEVCRFAASVAGFDVPALILGETGTGKELLARAMHFASLRDDKPFFAVNCGAIPDELLESELFGHRKGAFTGAHANRIGLLEQADGGTVFLDEIGDISPAFQVKLLRFLQEGEIRPIGANETLHVDVRVIAATNKDLAAETRSRRYRDDLYYRLAVAPIRIPSLRERPRDIPAIAEALAERSMARHGKQGGAFAAEAIEVFVNYGWPGNIREMENQITRMLMLSDGKTLGAELIEPHILRSGGVHDMHDPVVEAFIGGTGELRDRVERMEARILRETLIRHRWNKSRTAEELGLSRVGLRAKLDRYGIEDKGAPHPMNGASHPL